MSGLLPRVGSTPGDFNSLTVNSLLVTGTGVIAALTVSGSESVGGNLSVAGSLSAGAFSPASISTSGVISTTNTTASTSVSTGALKVGATGSGGAGIQGALFAGSLNTAGVTASTNATASTSVASGAITTLGGIGAAGALFAGSLNTAGLTTSTSTVDSTNTSSGSITTLGGIGVAKKLNVAGQIKGSASISAISKTTGALVLDNGGLGVNGAIYGGNSVLDSVSTGGISSSGDISTNSTTASTSVSTGALRVGDSGSGGAGIQGALYAGSVHSGAGFVSTAGPSTFTTTGTDIPLTVSINMNLTALQIMKPAATFSFVGWKHNGDVSNKWGVGETDTNAFVIAHNDATFPLTIAESTEALTYTGTASFTDTTDASTLGVGAIVTAGGLSVAKAQRIGGQLISTEGSASSSFGTGAVVVAGGIGASDTCYLASVVTDQYAPSSICFVLATASISANTWTKITFDSTSTFGTGLTPSSNQTWTTGVPCTGVVSANVMFDGNSLRTQFLAQVGESSAQNTGVIAFQTIKGAETDGSCAVSLSTIARLGSNKTYALWVYSGTVGATVSANMGVFQML